MSNPQIPNRSSLSGGRSNIPGPVNDLAKNPAVIALAAAFGLVLIAAVISTIMGIAEDMQKRQQGIHK